MLKSSYSCQPEKMADFCYFEIFTQADAGVESGGDQFGAIKK